MYLSIDDIKQGIYAEILNVLTREEENVNTAIKEAMAEVRAYLSARYDMIEEYSKTGNERNIMVLKVVRDIAIYNCYKLSNPVNMPERRVQSYHDTIKLLKDFQGEKAAIPGLSRLQDSTGGGSNYIRFGGNKPRKNHY